MMKKTFLIALSILTLTNSLNAFASTLDDNVIEDLEKFVNEAHSYGLKTALAGSVKKEQLKPLNDIGCDVVGIRGAACVGGDRNTGKIHHSAVAELKELCDSF